MGEKLNDRLMCYNFDMNFDVFAIGIVFTIILFSMVLHEMAHGYTAYFLGDNTAKEEGRLSLNPFSHIDPVMSIIVPLLLFISGGPIFGGAKPVPVVQRRLKGGEWGMALVALSGPFVNFLIAFVGFLIGYLSGGLAAGGYIGLFFKQLVLANLGFMIFNLIPIPPLDGSRVVYVLAPDFIRDLFDRAEKGMGIFLVLALVYVFGNYLSIFTSSIMVSILKFFYFIVGAK